VTSILDLYDELVSLRLAESRRLWGLLRKQGWVILDLEGLQPDVGHRSYGSCGTVLSGEAPLARSLSSSPNRMWPR
jgi:hypothetical protein